jgi:hypothetical protein
MTEHGYEHRDRSFAEQAKVLLPPLGKEQEPQRITNRNPNDFLDPSNCCQLVGRTRRKPRVPAGTVPV